MSGFTRDSSVSFTDILGVICCCKTFANVLLTVLQIVIKRQENHSSVYYDSLPNS